MSSDSQNSRNPQSAKNEVLTRAVCRGVLDESTFKLRPSDYSLKYPKWPGSVGLEIEMLPVKAPKTGERVPQPVPLQRGEESIAAILRRFAKDRGFKTEETQDDHGHPLLLRVLMDEEDNLSFEPGGQLEFSSRPYPCLSDAGRRMRSVQETLATLFQPHGIELVQVGVNPWHTIPELGLQMPKGRYRAMDRFFAGIGEYGQRMMRQTCTVQVNLDFGPTEEMLARRYLGGMLMAPMAAATFANSPFVDRRALADAPKKRGFRREVWRHVDPTRTGLPGLEAVASKLTRAACIDSYLDFAMAARVVFVTDLDYYVPDIEYKNITFGEWLSRPIKGHSPTLDDFKTHMSLLFAEVRPRGFLELRSVDCQPRAFQMAPAAYWTGLLYHDATLDKLIELLLPHRQEMDHFLVAAEEGLQDPALRRLSQQVIDLAETGFAALAPCFGEDQGAQTLRAFNQRFTSKGRTPADDIVDWLAAKASDGAPRVWDKEALTTVRADQTAFRDATK